MLRKIIQIDEKQGATVRIRHGGKPLFHVPHHRFAVKQATKRVLRLWFPDRFLLGCSVSPTSLTWVLFVFHGILLCHTGNVRPFCESSSRPARANSPPVYTPLNRYELLTLYHRIHI